MALIDVAAIGILTGDGDCPGLNPAIRAVVLKARSVGVRTVGLRDGWQGLLGSDPALARELDASDVRDIDRLGGTVLGTSRTNPLARPGGPERVLRRMDELGLDALVAIGGEDTLGVVHRLGTDLGLRAVGIPKTIDRDLSATAYTLGFETAVQVVTDAIDRLRTTAESHGRIFVIETMGGAAGHLALRGGIAGGADLVLIPEVPIDVGRVCSILAERRASGSRYSMIVVAEGAVVVGGGRSLVSAKIDEFGHKMLGGIGSDLAAELESRTFIETRHVALGHLQRGGPPVAYDRRMGLYFGTAAVEAVLSGRFGTMTALQDGHIRLVPLSAAVDRISLVDVERDYDPLNFRYGGRVLGEADY